MISYLYGPDGLFAIDTRFSNGLESLYYVHKDHLGSIEALTDESGKLLEEYSYDPWGLRRDPNTWKPFKTSTTLKTDRGFTGHEHLDLFSFINMNGRVYDPVIGYFSSPDPMIVIPGSAKQFNPYAYTGNNPLSFTDPTGFFGNGINEDGDGDPYPPVADHRDRDWGIDWDGVWDWISETFSSSDPSLYNDMNSPPSYDPNRFDNVGDFYINPDADSDYDRGRYSGIDNYVASPSANNDYIDLGQGESGGGDPFIDIELTIKIGLTYSERLMIFGLGEEFKANAISIDYMTFNWNSNTNRIKYTPYRTATSSISYGLYGLYAGIKQDWGQMQFSPYGQLGLAYLERGSPTRFNIIDIGYMYGFGFDFKVTISPNMVINSYINYQSDWNDKVGWSIYPFLH